MTEDCSFGMKGRGTQRMVTRLPSYHLNRRRGRSNPLPPRDGMVYSHLVIKKSKILDEEIQNIKVDQMTIAIQESIVTWCYCMVSTSYYRYSHHCWCRTGRADSYNYSDTPSFRKFGRSNPSGGSDEIKNERNYSAADYAHDYPVNS